MASEGAYLAALVTDLTPELEQEGLAREFVRRVQDLRKQADLDIADRITVFLSLRLSWKKRSRSSRLRHGRNPDAGMPGLTCHPTCRPNDSLRAAKAGIEP